MIAPEHILIGVGLDIYSLQQGSGMPLQDKKEWKMQS